MAFAASTAPHDLGRSPGDMESMKMGITKIYKGDLVVIKTNGYAYSVYETGAAGDQFVGVAAETVDNLTNAVGATAALGEKEIRVWLEGIFTFDVAASTIGTDLGLTVYATEGTTTDGPRMVITAAPGAHPFIVGVITKLLGDVTAATTCRVRISSFSAVAA